MNKKAIHDILDTLSTGEATGMSRRNLDKLVRVYRKLFRDITARLVRLTGVTKKTAIIAAEREIALLIRMTEKEAGDILDGVIAAGFHRGVDIANAQGKMTAAKLIKSASKKNVSAADILSRKTELDLRVLSSSIQTTALRYTESLKLAKLRGKRAGKALTARLDIIDSMAAGQALTAGNRSIDVERYIQTLGEQRSRDATTEATLMSLDDLSTDLVVWDNHDGACEKCRPYLGKVYSVSGDDKNFPRLTVRPSVHPNCRCTIYPISGKYMKENGFYERMVDISNSGYTVSSADEHRKLLTRKSFSLAERSRKERA